MLALTRAVVALLALSLVAGTASAASAVNVLDLAAETQPLETGGSTSLPFKVNFQADGFGCAQGGSVTIPLTVEGTPPPPGVIVSVEPAEVTINIPAGLYMSGMDGAPVSAFNGSADATLTVTAENVTQNATVPLTVVATFPGGTPTGCHGELSEASGEAGTTATVVAPPPPPPEPLEVQEEGKLLPAPGALAALAAVGAALVIARRRA